MNRSLDLFWSWAVFCLCLFAYVYIGCHIFSSAATEEAAQLYCKCHKILCKLPLPLIRTQWQPLPRMVPTASGSVSLHSALWHLQYLVHRHPTVAAYILLAIRLAPVSLMKGKDLTHTASIIVPKWLKKQINQSTLFGITIQNTDSQALCWLWKSLLPPPTIVSGFLLCYHMSPGLSFALSLALNWPFLP